MVDVKFGVMVPNFPSDGCRGHEFATRIIEYLKGLEDHYDSVWIPDHFLPPPFISDTNDQLECLTTIGHLSGIFPKLSFGTIVLCNSYRNPALVAKMGATLAAWTGGRFILGIGAGWQLEEGVRIIRRMWTEDEVTFNGRYFSVENAICYPKPDPPPPIMIGARGEQLGLGVVARQADWWNIQMIDIDTFKQKLGVLERHCERSGRDPDEIVRTVLQAVVIADSEEEARKIERENPGGAANFVGTPETVGDQVREFVEVGVEHFILLFLPFPSIDGSLLFAEEIISEYK